MDKDMFPNIFSHAQQAAFTPSNIRSGFRKTGICISKKNQFALFAFQRTLHLLAAFCRTIFLKSCNQKTRFILRLI